MKDVKRNIDVFGIGNALVDTIVYVDDDFIREHALTKGMMTLADSPTQANLLTAIEGKRVELHSGGSAANTIHALVLNGASAFYCSKLASDPNGEFYRQDLLNAGVHFDVHPVPEGSGSTGSCLIFVTPDAERTMHTHLGVSTELSINDVDTDRLAGSKYLYMEGYLWDAENPRKACLAAAESAKKAGVKVSLTFSDPFCVGRYKEEFFHASRELCDVIFCNLEEARHFSGMEKIEDAAAYIGNLCDLVFVTNSAEGAIVVENKKMSSVSGFPVKPQDTTGAGDAFAAGVLHGLTHGLSPQESARWGNYLASETVQFTGARLHETRKHMLEKIIAAQ